MHVLAPKFFWGWALEILDPYLLIEHTLHHRAKFCGDWPMELRDLVVRKKDNKCEQNISLLRKRYFRAD